MIGDEPQRVRIRWPRPGFELDVDFAWPTQGITALFGASGAGKTTVLRCVAGLDRAPEADIVVAGTAWQDGKRFVPTWKRPLGYVFQEASLFDHLDVAANLAFARRRAPAARPAGDDVVELLGIGPLLKRRPAQLSGGERQRVAIARALATQPRVLLLDEPLAAIDVARRQEILPWLERLRDEVRLPMLYVTHSLDELARLADTLVLLEAGRVRAAGPARELLARADLPLARGDDAGTLLEGHVAALDAEWHLARVDFDSGALWIADAGLRAGERVRLRVLARDVSLALVPPTASSIQNVVACDVREVLLGPQPSQAIVRLAAGEARLLARITARAAHQLRLAPGDRVLAQVKAAALVR